MPYYSDDEIIAAVRREIAINERIRREAEEAKRHKQEGWFRKFLKDLGVMYAIELVKGITRALFGWP